MLFKVGSSAFANLYIAAGGGGGGARSGGNYNDIGGRGASGTSGGSGGVNLSGFGGGGGGDVMLGAGAVDRQTTHHPAVALQREIGGADACRSLRYDIPVGLRPAARRPRDHRHDRGGGAPSP